MTTSREPTGSGPTEPTRAGAPAMTEPRTSGYAIAALVLGLFPTLGIGSVLAIGFGIRARRDIDRTRMLRGRGMATAGIVLGVIGLVASAFFWLLVLTALVSGASVR